MSFTGGVNGHPLVFSAPLQNYLLFLIHPYHLFAAAKLELSVVKVLFSVMGSGSVPGAVIEMNE